MRPKLSRLRLIGLIVVCLGLLAALAVYVANAPGADDEAEAAGPYVAAPHETKRYRYELERFGGKASLIFDDLRLWFGSLWHGRRLAGTIVVLSLVVGAGFWRAGRR